MENWLSVTMTQACDRLGRSMSAILSKARRTGLRRTGEWSQEEIDILRLAYPTEDTVRIAWAVKRTADEVDAKADEIGVAKWFQLMWADDGFVPKKCDKPTQLYPGTSARVEEYSRRVQGCMELFHEDDKRMPHMDMYRY